VVGASAGGIAPLKTLAAGLPADLPASVAVVLHVSPDAPSRLPQILAHAGPLRATHAENGEPLEAGRIVVAPPDRHLLVAGGRCVVVRGPRENQARPAIDPLFRSAASTFGDRVVAVILSGARSDGVAGCAAVSARGGTVFVQRPDEADFPDMPEAAIAVDHPSAVLHLSELAAAIAAAVADWRGGAPISDNGQSAMNLENSYAAFDEEVVERGRPPGSSSTVSCPACGGVLWEVDEGELLRFRCRVGHAYTAESTLEDQAEVVDRALWSAFRALHEKAALAERIAARNDVRGRERTRTRFEAMAQEAREQADVIRDVLLQRDAAA
jgi:two-component system chemotaxis response regulator CheB